MPFRLINNPAVVSGPLRIVLVGCRVLVAFLLLSGAAAVVAWLPGLSWLSGPIGGWRNMPPDSGIAVIALGLALWGRVADRRGVVFAGVAVALTAAILSPIALQQGWTASPLDRMEQPSAVLIGVAALGLLSGTLPLWPALEKVALGLAGLILVASTVTLTFARAVGILSLGRAGSIPNTSAQLVAGMLLLGFCFVGLVWASNPRDFEPPRWLPLTTGVISLITVMMLWNKLAERERDQARESARQAAAAEARLLRREIAVSARSLQRVAEWTASGVPFEQQEHELVALQRDIPSLVAAIRLAPDGTPLVVVPALADPEPVIALWRLHAGGRGAGPDSTTYLPLDSTASRLVIFTPVCATTCSGTMAGVIDAAVLFEPTLTDTLRSFRFSIAGPAGPLPGSLLPPVRSVAVARDRPLDLGEVRWRLSAWAVSDGMVSGTNLPGTVLFMGMLVTLLLPLTLHLGRSAWVGAQDRERARLSFALDRATDGLWELHLPTGQAIRSPSLWRHLQYEPENVPPTFEGWASLMHPDDRGGVESALMRHLSGEADGFEAEYRVRAGDGSWHTVVDRGRIVDRTPLGAPSRMLGISANVTEARVAARARDESERRFRALFNSGFQFQVLLSCDCRVIEVNQVALDHSGRTMEQVRDRECWDTLWWEDNAAAQQILRDACTSANAGRSESWEQAVRLPDRGPLILELSLKPIHDDDGALSQLLLEGRDITERRRVEIELKEVDTLTTMGRVAARVAHEINNPLAGIQSAFMLVKDAVPTDHPHFRYVGAIEREVERIARVTRQLYETYRPEQDTTGAASLHLVVGDAVAFLEQVNRSRDVRIVTDLARVAATVSVPAAILRQIVYNLVQNAIDASPPGGVVSIVAGMSATALDLRVRDQGAGIPDGLREQIFEPFFSTKDREVKQSGMGLGLALVRRTVAAAGGTIAVENHAEGGAEFIVLLPLEAEHKGDAA